jgi:hypothetical protein
VKFWFIDSSILVYIDGTVNILVLYIDGTANM